MIQRARGWKIGSMLAMSLLAGCVGDMPPSVQNGFSLRFATLDSSCQQTVNGSNKIPDDVAQLVAVLRRPDGSTETYRVKRSAVQSTGSWLIKGISEGQQLEVDVFGCSADGQVTYAGRSRGAKVVDQQKTSLRAFLAPVGALACTGDESLQDKAGQSGHLLHPTSMASAAAMPNGDAVIAGGLQAWDHTSKAGTASRFTAIYDHRTGHFREGPTMLAPRVWHHVVALDAEHVWVIGGVSQVADFGASSLASPVLAPTDVPASQSAPVSEVLRLSPAANGGPQAPLTSVADVGAGAHFMSSALRQGDAVWFVGGVEASGQASTAVTRLSGLDLVAQGQAGSKVDHKLQFKRVRPGLIPAHDGGVLVWGGNVDAKADQLAELVSADGTKSNVLKIEGDAALLAKASLVTASPAVAVAQQDADKTVFVVIGGMPFSSPYAANDAPSYVAVFEHATGVVTLKLLSASGKPLHGGLTSSATRLSDGRILIAGGLVALASGAPCEDSEPECLLDSVHVLTTPFDISGDAVDVSSVDSAAFSTGQLGVAVAPLPIGALLAGGQSSVLKTSDTEPLTTTARVMVPKPLDSDALCKP